MTGCRDKGVGILISRHSVPMQLAKDFRGRMNKPWDGKLDYNLPMHLPYDPVICPRWKACWTRLHDNVPAYIRRGSLCQA